MNKDYLPFYESLKDDDKEFWLNCSKEKLIDHIVSNIRNGETLLSRINKAIEYINEKADYPIGYYHCLKELRDILKGEGK
jgi:hypothetical protein